MTGLFASVAPRRRHWLLAIVTMVAAAGALPGAAPAQEIDAPVPSVGPVLGGETASEADLRANLRDILSGKPVDGSALVAPIPREQPINNHEVVLKAPVDECYFQTGYPNPTPVDGKCPTIKGQVFRPKVNGQYPWSMTSYKSNIFMGTGENPMCNVTGVMGPAAPFQTADGTCEEGAGLAARTFGLTSVGDLRPPHIWFGNKDTGTWREITPTPQQDPDVPFVIAMRLGATSTTAGVTFIGGVVTHTGSPEGMNLIAFDSNTGQFLGQQTRTDITSARLGVEVEGKLYITARTAIGGGAILKWTGTHDDPFHFEQVGTLDNDPAHPIVWHNHIITNGWPAMIPRGYTGNTARIMMSPQIPPGGELTAADATKWKDIFNACQWDPDPFLCHSRLFGSVVVWHDKLFFGTQDYPGLPDYYLLDKAGRPKSDLETLLWLSNITVPIQIYSMANPGQANQKITLLYGQKMFNVFNFETKQWSKKQGNMGLTPKFGKSGFGNNMNLYSFTFRLFQDRLYMGTFDAYTLFKSAASSGLLMQPVDFGFRADTVGKLFAPMNLMWNMYGGADIWRMDSPNRPAVPETLHAFGSKYIHGMRTGVVYPDQAYFGMASAYNLKTGPDQANFGGWEIVKLTPNGNKTGPLTFAKPLKVDLSINGSGASAAQNVPVVGEGRLATFRALVRNTGQTVAQLVRTCVTLPRGFTPVGLPATAFVDGRQVCFGVPQLPAGGSKAFAIQARAPQRTGPAVAVASAGGAAAGAGGVKARDVARARLAGGGAPATQQPSQQPPGGAVTGSLHAAAAHG